MKRAMNFNPGPAVLPLPALERAREELLDFAGSGMSVMEHSHRGKDYEAVHDEAISLLKELLAIPASHDVLFLQGGASQLFAQIPMNFLGPGRTADFVVNGHWGERAVSEARLVAALIGGTARLGCTTAEGDKKEKDYFRAPRPDEMKVDPDATYVHATSNETMHGIQFEADPSRPLPDPGKVPLIVDSSSDFLWRKLDVGRFAIVYAGAQKNLGPSGVVVVVASREFVARGRTDIPKIFQLRTAADNRSLFNTPPTFSIYMVRNVLAWLKSIGGLEKMEAQNRSKAARLYAAIDANPSFFRCPVERASRSLMNVVFRLPTEEHESRFVAMAKERGMIGLKGHRLVGGIRASLYNAVLPEWVDELVSFMGDFARLG